MMKPRMLVGLIGANIMRSLSPALFAAAYADAGIDGFYHLMDVDRLPGRTARDLVAAAKMAGFAGLNVTYPFKQEVIPLLDEIDPAAAQVGAINTIVFAPDGRAKGYNFDRRGWRRSFEEKLGADSARGATVVMVGAGGAGRAVACALMDLGVGTLSIHDRDTARAQALREDVARHFGGARCRVTADLAGEMAAADGVVNATNIGMLGFPGNAVPVGPLKASHWCADVIYTPIQTEFLKVAAAKGARVLNGAGMCVHQAVEAFALFAGTRPDPARLTRAFEAALALRDA